MKPNQFVTIATLMGNLGSLGQGTNKLILQSHFPLWYCEQKYEKGEPENLEYDRLIHADDDRCRMWDYDHVQKVSMKYFGKPGFTEFSIRNMPESKIIPFLQEILKADEHHPGREWTGYRITGTVHRGNGYCILSLDLFSKGSETNTEVYSGEHPANTTIDIEHARSLEHKMRSELFSSPTPAGS